MKYPARPLFFYFSAAGIFAGAALAKAADAPATTSAPAPTVVSASAPTSTAFFETAEAAANRKKLAADLAAAPAPKSVVIPPLPAGPFAATWDSLRDNYQPPQWLYDAKFGLTMHWGLFSVPARQSEWYVRYMYGGNAPIQNDHIAKWGPLDQFGYKDFIPMFTAAKWDPDAWATLFKKSGAKFFSPTAEHHDGFSLWNSELNKFNSVNFGPHRDIMGEISAAVRKQGLHFGINNHSYEHFDFIPASANSDQNDPDWKDFYHVYNRTRADRDAFNQLWVAKNMELIDKYQPELLWFDNGVNGRQVDALKLQVAAYLYNRALQWGKQVSMVTKGNAYLFGSVRDYERQGRIAPREIKNFVWEVDDPIGSKFGYVKEIKYKDAGLLVRRIVDTASMNGVYMLNLSPLPDGTIPQEQQDRLLAIGKWFDVNGEALYGTQAWTRYGEGPFYALPTGPLRGAGPDDPVGESYTGQEIRFTTKGDTLYALVMDWPGDTAVITALATGSKDLPAGKIEKVELLGHQGNLEFAQDAEGLKVTMPKEKPGDFVYALKITGLKAATPGPADKPAAAASAAASAPNEIPQ